MKILVKGVGVGGLTVAYELLSHGLDVTVACPEGLAGSASWCAGGMLAPYCEGEHAPKIFEKLGLYGIQWWNNVLPEDVVRHGTLVLAPRRAHFELDRFAARTKGHSMLSADEIATLEPDLAGRFQRGLFFISEAHFDPRQALERLMIRLKQGGVSFIVSTEQEVLYDFVIDATGSSRLPLDRNLRGVRGEMLLIRTKDVHLSRPVRLLHPRIPLYVVPRKENIFMIGATMIESHNNRLMSVRSMMEFLNAAYALHPAFSEAEIIETGVGIRPAYANNFPRIERKQKFFFVNGFYRHGYLLAPEMARRIAHLVLHAESENEEL